MTIDTQKWVRDGSIIGPGGEQVDIRCDPDGANWITVKGPDCEAITAAVLAAPKLLSALKNCMQWLELADPEMDHPGVQEAISQAGGVILEAEAEPCPAT